LVMLRDWPVRFAVITLHAEHALDVAPAIARAPAQANRFVVVVAHAGRVSVRALRRRSHGSAGNRSARCGN
jgi:hypothetical protein